MLEFEINGQRLRLKGNLYVVAESVDYLKARFAFSADWDGAAKTAIFKTADRKGVYNVILDENGICTVPSEVIHAPRFYVSVFGGSRITANEVEVQCNVSGYAEGSAPDTPTPEVYEQILAEINKKVSKVDGMGLSENSYTTDEKTKLDGIAEGAEVNVQSDWSQTNADADDYIKNKPTKLSQFENDSGYATSADLSGLSSGLSQGITNVSNALSNHQSADVLPHADGSVTTAKLAEGAVTKEKIAKGVIPTSLPASDVYDWAKQPEKPKYTAAEVGALPYDTEIPSYSAATQTTDGLMSAADKKKLDGLSEGGGGGIKEETDPTIPSWAKQPEKPKYTAAEVGALPYDTEIPSYSAATQTTDGLMSAADKKKLDGLSEGGGGGIKEETDPTIPSWAKQPEKPKYTAAEVGADSAGSADSALTAAKKYTDEKVKTNVPENAVFTDTVYDDTEIKAALGSEETARSSADTTLQNNINDEASARANGDGALQDSLSDHMNDTSNPHSVTKSQVGLGNVPNVATNDQTPTYTQASTLANLTSGEKLSVSLGKIMKAIADFISHKNSTSNPHSITKSQVGLGNVPNVATNDQTPTYTQASTLANLTSGEKLSVSLGKIMKAIADFISHKNSTSNPHSITKSQVGLGNVPNVATNDQTPTYTQASTLANLTSGEKLSVSLGKIMKAIADFITHKNSTSNPHSVTKSQVGLGNVDNTSDANKPISTAMQTALNGKLDKSGGTMNTDTTIKFTINTDDRSTEYGSSPIHNIRTNGQWASYAMTYITQDASKTNFGGFGAYGDPNTLEYFFVGDWNDCLLKIMRANGKIYFKNSNGYTALDAITANLNKSLHSASSTPYDTGRVWLNGAAIMRMDFCIVVNNTSYEYIRKQVMFSDIDSILGNVNIINAYAAAYYGDYTSGSDISMSNIDGITITYDNMAIYFPDNLSTQYSSVYVVGFAEYTENLTLPNANITKILSE